LPADKTLPCADETRSGDGVAGTGRIMLYHNIACEPPASRTFSMTHHHHHGDAPHPSSVIALSLLRLSALQRIAVAGVLITLIWAAFLWATR